MTDFIYAGVHQEWVYSHKTVVLSGLKAVAQTPNDKHILIVCVSVRTTNHHKLMCA